jgi:type I restriction enzyme S subunit
MGEERFISASKETITDAGAAECKGRLVEPNTLLMSFKLSIGKLGFAKVPLYTNEAIAALPVRDPSRLSPEYLYYALQVIDLLAETDKAAKGKTLNKKKIQRLPIPLPPLAEQRRIAEVLDSADALRAKRRRAQERLDDLLRAVFVEMFGDPVLNPKGWPVVALAELADVVSGVTKGKKNKGHELVTLPYMRVANVQDGHIDLSEIKEIAVTLRDAERYALQEGDVLLTEGGDPDKLGRGAVWGGEVDPCIHQNHIFRVRANRARLLPEFASAVVGSERGKRYFLGVAKQTTGIASINKTQLNAFPMLLPPLDRQHQYVQLVSEVSRIVAKHATKDAYLNDLYHSLAQRAFRGELTGVGR